MPRIPNRPGVVYIERDNSNYPPNVESSVAGIVGFSDRGPTDKATLITSQQQLLSTFGQPRDGIPGQGLEGALELLEVTNRPYFVRAANDSALDASANVQLGFCPCVEISAVTGKPWGVTSSLQLTVQVTDNDGNAKYSTPKTFQIPSGTNSVSIEALSDKVGSGTFLDEHVFIKQDTNGRIFLAGMYAGSGATLAVSAASATTGSFTATSLAYAIAQISSTGDVSAYNSTTLTSSVSSKGGHIQLASLSFLATSKWPGAGYVLGTKPNGQTSGVSVEIDSANGANFFLSVNDGGVEQEKYTVNILSNDANFIGTVLTNTTDTNNPSELIKGLLNASGVAVTSTVNTLADVWGSNLNVVMNSENQSSKTPRFIKAVEKTTSMSGGHSGYGNVELGDSDDSNNTDVAALIGASSDKSGMYALDDDSLDITIALVPGIVSQSVQNALITLAESSQNFIAPIAPPYGLNTVQEAVDWANGKDNGRTAGVNSSYAAIYWPWVQVFNTFEGRDIWYDPAIFGARQMLHTDNVAETWFAPFGFRRGRLTKPSDVEVVLNSGDQETLQDANINPIVKFVPEGITIWGQKTAQRLATALDRVNVRRLMIFIRKLLLITGRPFVSEPNDEFLWDQIKETLNPVFDDIQNRRGITEYSVTCDESTNTPLKRDRNEVWTKIEIKPTKAAEKVVFEVNLTSQSARIIG